MLAVQDVEREAESAVGNPRVEKRGQRSWSKMGVASVESLGVGVRSNTPRSDAVRRPTTVLRAMACCRGEELERDVTPSSRSPLAKRGFEGPSGSVALASLQRSSLTACQRCNLLESRRPIFSTQVEAIGAFPTALLAVEDEERRRAKIVDVVQRVPTAVGVTAR